MKGRGELMERASCPGQEPDCNQVIKNNRARIQQKGQSYQTVTVQYREERVTGKVPRHLCNSAKKQGIIIKNTWRNNACAESLNCVQQSLKMIYGTPRRGSWKRDAAVLHRQRIVGR